jgi:Ser/Thr protein kinase RdoA (MazF antagonist)
MARAGAHSLSTAARDAALADAIAVGRALGLVVDQAVVLSDNLNLIVELRPAPVVARVAVRTAQVRSPDALGDSLGLARFLADRGLPVAAPVDDLDAGPHRGPRTGRPMTFWKLLRGTRPDDPADPAFAGRTLRALHEAAAHYAGPLRHVGPLEEVARLAALIEPDRPDSAAWFREILARIEVPAAAAQALHGDAHLGNVLATASGPVWIDWEESWRGPLAWDHASLDHRRRVFGELADEIDAAFAAYGPVDAEAIDAWAPVVALWALAWGMRGALELGEDVSDRALARRAYLERRFGVPAPR